MMEDVFARRRRKNDNPNEEGADFRSIEENTKLTPKIQSLLIPWASLALFAVCCTAVNSYLESMNDDESNNNVVMNYLSTAYRSLMMEDDASSVQDDLDHHEHHHHDIIQEDHEPLFPLTRSDYYGFGFATIGLMIAAGGGIGGGGILVPTYILVLGFSPKHAIPLSNITVFGGAVANTILNTRKRHPLADRPLVDWDLILVMEPLTIAGALIGAFLNKLLPETLLTVMLVALLSFTAYNTLTKATKMYKKETQQMRQQSGFTGTTITKESELTKMTHDHEEEDNDAASDSLLKNMEQNHPDDGDHDEVDHDAKTEQLLSKQKKQKQQEELQTELEIILEEERNVPNSTIMVLVAMFVVVLAINLLKGGGAFPSPIGIKCGSMSFWVANALMLGWILFISLLVRMYLIDRYDKKKRAGYKYVEGDIQWDERATVVYPCICCLAGFFAGMFGVGGGIVKGPLMLAMGVHPAVSSASSACMILFTSFTATTSFIVFGLLVPDYALVCLCLGFVATIVGQVGLSYLMKRYQRNSYIAFSIGGVVLLSAFLMTIQSLLSLAEGEHHHSGGICGKDE